MINAANKSPPTIAGSKSPSEMEENQSLGGDHKFSYEESILVAILGENYQ